MCCLLCCCNNGCRNAEQNGNGSGCGCQNRCGCGCQNRCGCGCRISGCCSAAETAIRSLAVPERPVPAAAAEHRQRTGNAGHTVRDTATAGTGGTGRAGMMLSGAGMAETEIAAEIKTYKNSNCRKSPGIYRDFSAFVTVLT